MRIAIAACAAGALALGVATGGARNGSTQKPTCKNGGWATLYRTDGTSFKNQDKCLDYVAAGGKLYTTVRPKWQIDCEAFGGKSVDGPTLYCRRWLASSAGQYEKRNAVLAADCDRITFGTRPDGSTNQFTSFCTAVTSTWQIDCELFGGTSIDGLVLYCRHWVATSHAQFEQRNAALASDCHRLSFGTAPDEAENRFTSFCTNEGG
jgi:hypothetical protein